MQQLTSERDVVNRLTSTPIVQNDLKATSDVEQSDTAISEVIIKKVSVVDALELAALDNFIDCLF